jgi:hypothetical protein
VKRKEMYDTYHEGVTKPNDTQIVDMRINTTAKLVSKTLMILT